MLNKPCHRIIKTITFTALALIAFAANSVLCRFALGGKTIDAASFTVIRLLSGVLVLFVIMKLHTDKKSLPSKGRSSEVPRAWFAKSARGKFCQTLDLSH
jgi:hypothetical protein